MAKKPRKPPNEDAEQSRRFLETARELEAGGDLSPTAGDDFERLARKALPPRHRPKTSG